MSGIDVQGGKEGFQRKDSFWKGCENTGLVQESNQVRLRATRYLMACLYTGNCAMSQQAQWIISKQAE